MINKKTCITLVKNVTALVLTAGMMSACVGVVASPSSQWVPGHVGKYGQWVPGHYVSGGPIGSTWDAGHWSNKGNWKPGHWK